MDVDPVRLQRWIAEKWRHGPCPVCHASEWAPNQRYGQISNLDYAGKMVPVVLIVCGNCGYTLTINALTADLLPPAEPE